MNKNIISTKAVESGGQNGGNSPISSFVMPPVTEVQVSRLFSSLNVQKSPLDVPNKLIEIAAEPLWKPSAHIYNHSIKTGIGLLSLSAFNRFLFCCSLPTYVYNQKVNSSYQYNEFPFSYQHGLYLRQVQNTGHCFANTFGIFRIQVS